MCVFQAVLKYLYRREFQRDTEERKKASAVTGRSIANVPKDYGHEMPFDDFEYLKGWHDSLKKSQEKFDKFVSQTDVFVQNCFALECTVLLQGINQIAFVI